MTILKSVNSCVRPSRQRKVTTCARKHLTAKKPIMDGIAAARELRMIMPEIPIILFTQYGDLGKYLRGASLPVDRVVSKSDMEELMRHVRSLIPI
jgi:CheY-like chemotaxis protein